MGGPFFEYHVAPLSSFSPNLSGNAVVIGGVGYGTLGKNFRIGGGGGGGFVWDASLEVEFGMGYGGVIGEYSITNWMKVNMLIGGGGYSLARILSKTESTTTLEKIASGGFVLFYPGISFEIEVKKFLFLSTKIGYFLPGDARLHSFTLGFTLLIGTI